MGYNPPTMATKTIERPVTQVRTAGPIGDTYGWKTKLYNCNCHSFDEVIGALMRAIGCSATTGERIANTVHTTGEATVCQGSKLYCESVASVLAEIGLKVAVLQEE